MRLKLYLNKETVRLFRIVSPDSNDFIILFPVNFSRTASGSCKMTFVGDTEQSDYNMLYKLYEPLITEIPTKLGHSTDRAEMVKNATGETIWYIPAKVFTKYVDKYELCENHLYEEKEHE